MKKKLLRKNYQQQNKISKVKLNDLSVSKIQRNNKV